MEFPHLLFTILASLAVLCGLLVVTRRNAVHSALFLVGVFLSVAGIYVLLGAEFLAAVQLLVYAGGILVLFLFVIMLVKIDKTSGPRRRSFLSAVALLLVVALAAMLGSILFQGGQGGTTGPPPVVPGAPGNMERVGLSLFKDYLLPFEVASVFLLVAMIGAIVLARESY